MLFQRALHFSNRRALKVFESSHFMLNKTVYTFLDFGTGRVAPRSHLLFYWEKCREAD